MEGSLKKRMNILKRLIWLPVILIGIHLLLQYVFKLQNIVVYWIWDIIWKKPGEKCVNSCVCVYSIWDELVHSRQEFSSYSSYSPSQYAPYYNSHHYNSPYLSGSNVSPASIGTPLSAYQHPEHPVMLPDHSPESHTGTSAAHEESTHIWGNFRVNFTPSPRKLTWKGDCAFSLHPEIAASLLFGHDRERHRFTCFGS